MLLPLLSCLFSPCYLLPDTDGDLPFLDTPTVGAQPLCSLLSAAKAAWQGEKGAEQSVFSSRHWVTQHSQRPAKGLPGRCMCLLPLALPQAALSLEGSTFVG